MAKDGSTPFQAASSATVQQLIFNPLAWVLWMLDFFIWFCTVVGPVRFLLSFVPVPHAIRSGEAWRLYESRQALLTTPYEEARTVPDLIQRAIVVHGDRPACGVRKYLGEHHVEGSKFPLKKFGETEWLTYREFGQRIDNFGAGLVSLGLRPAPGGLDLQTSDGPHTLLIFEETCLDWATACLGAFTQSITVATSYATLGLEAVAEAINETGARAVVCNQKDVAKLAAFMGSKCPCLETLIYTSHYAGEAKPQTVPRSGSRILSVADVILLGKEHTTSRTPPTPEHLAVIMYTSGSTGKPKGVMIKHSSAVASIAAIAAKFRSFGCQEGEETYIAYLPAAHILELVAELSMFSMGCAVGFGCTKSISSKGACRLRPDGSVNTKPGYPYPPGSIQEFRPTIMVAVPKIWDILKKGVEEVIGQAPATKRTLFRIAYAGRRLALDHGLNTPLVNALVFSKTRELLGGRLKFGITGGGPVSADVQNFIRVAFAMPLVQGYGLTETSCAGTVQTLEDVRCGVVGPPLGSVEMKLRSCVACDGEPEVMDRNRRPYLADDTEHYGTACVGRGEVLIRGPSVSSGYFKQPDKTAEAYDSDGWFHTGDVGIFMPDGALMLVDRIKNLVKLKGGEYIAIESMEKEYATSAFVNGVNGGVMCYGDGDMDRPVALVQVNAAELERWAAGVHRLRCFLLGRALLSL
eukprot:TRINITY_DN63920_c0_g1_i1.p1 TRINITY_DN63920_c0_g1~~TRINITY_DN63920_c0_g1_i1.p1  ORF type:complete len:693 (+),score=66.50 TRINITY_DN63920_c0_g1_i1:91-2169(+)